jgi:hypothetical protein
MRDDQTGTYWQQISGLAISGPLKGTQLALVLSDELTFATWKSENPEGTVLNDVPEFVTGYAKKDWDVRMKRTPTVIDFPEHSLKARDLMLGIQANGASRAFLLDRVLKEKLVKDRVGSEPVVLVVGPDDQSVRVFCARIPEVPGITEFYRVTGTQPGDPAGALFMDDTTGSHWNFQGCAIAGKAKGTCLQQLPAVKDYWFDWRNYNPKTTVYGKE